ncbi:phosphopantothenoylcysteine decarboxylase [Kamptonema cortianum]|nr:phosphopantothenoylcysteine decarboxylase [Oscillatoria laete-virens]MDK3159889.1 phosphopantothenoylcysteine decarboxylase [Kamptonema cortianum]MDL5050541.1 phosphopantothenoylcysteine decarboxylase [Oscillatoria amoena NRMC-F 0135]MDL5055553.1 phosphopantothenoylcysteine decarboxylase [Oscillatoria laete-virens NRMC-F 0139]
MKIIVTAGPSHEPIDRVRRVTNFSTGGLGSRLAVFLADAGHEVLLFLGEGATDQSAVSDKRVQMARFTTAEILAEQFARAAEDSKRAPVNAVFHAAAVGDYRVAAVRDESGRVLEGGKIPTSLGRIFVEMIPTCKVLGKLRGLFPGAHIVGWKYETDGGREELIAKGRAQMASNDTDACVLNGPAWGGEGGFGLLDRAGSLTNAGDSADLFRRLDGLVRVNPGR